MTPYQKELLEVVRRLADRGLKVAWNNDYALIVDTFQAIKDELERIKNYECN